jgi:hypothetical protein
MNTLAYFAYLSLPKTFFITLNYWCQCYKTFFHERQNKLECLVFADKPRKTLLTFTFSAKVGFGFKPTY